MKFVILHGDGMGDWPIESLGGKTPLEAAHTPNLDRLAGLGDLGLIHTIPQGLPPGSDVGSLTLFGFDPRGCYTGRSPIEAAAMGIDLGDRDAAFRCNLIHLDLSVEDPVMEDFTAGHISTEEAQELLKAVQDELGGEGIEFHAGVSYRHCMVWRDGQTAMTTVPPHDISDKGVTSHLPSGEGEDRLRDLMVRSREILERHPVNQRRAERGEKTANQVWLWGQGYRPRVQSYREKFGLSGTVVSGVDLVKGLGVLCDLEVPDIEGATAWIDTNCGNKVAAALAGLEQHDFAYVHLEAPDEAGHQGDAAIKVKAIELFDAGIVGPILQGLEKHGAYRVLISPDHATPCATKTHTSEPSPFIFYDSEKHREPRADRTYNEKCARDTGLEFTDGYVVWNTIVKGQALVA